MSCVLMKINVFGSDGVKRVSATRWGVQRQVCLAYSQAWWWECHGLGLQESCRHWEAMFIEGTMNANMYSDILKQSMIPSLRRLGRRAVFQQDNDHCLAKEAEGKGDGLAKHVSRTKPIEDLWGRWRSARPLTSTSSVMSSWRSGRGLQWQPVKLWWTSCPKGLRQCWKIMVAHKILTLWAQFGHFHLGLYSLLWPAV